MPAPARTERHGRRHLALIPSVRQARGPGLPWISPVVCAGSCTLASGGLGARRPAGLGVQCDRSLQPGTILPGAGPGGLAAFLGREGVTVVGFIALLSQETSRNSGRAGGVCRSARVRSRALNAPGATAQPDSGLELDLVLQNPRGRRCARPSRPLEARIAGAGAVAGVRRCFNRLTPWPTLPSSGFFAALAASGQSSTDYLALLRASHRPGRNLDQVMCAD